MEFLNNFQPHFQYRTNHKSYYNINMYCLKLLLQLNSSIRQKTKEFKLLTISFHNINFFNINIDNIYKATRNLFKNIKNANNFLLSIHHFN